MDLHVLPECYIDTKLVKTLVPPQSRYNHQKGTAVLRRMTRELADQFALGVVDEDVQDREYAQAFEVIWHLADSLTLLKHPQQHHYLIYLCPAIEKWIIACANDAQLSLNDFGLPHDFNKLRKLTKTAKSEDNDPYSNNFRHLFKALQQSNPHNIAVLSFWISYLKTNPYSANLEWLIEEMNRLMNV